MNNRKQSRAKYWCELLNALLNKLIIYDNEYSTAVNIANVELKNIYLKNENKYHHKIFFNPKTKRFEFETFKRVGKRKL